MENGWTSQDEFADEVGLVPTITVEDAEWEIAAAATEAFEVGREQGYGEGFKDGPDDRYSEGYDDGYTDGRRDGYSASQRSLEFRA